MLNPSPGDLEFHVRAHLARLRDEADVERRLARARAAGSAQPSAKTLWRRLIARLRGRSAPRPRRPERGPAAPHQAPASALTPVRRQVEAQPTRTRPR